MSERIDLALLSDVIGLIYDASIGRAAWSHVLEAICRGLAIEAGALSTHDPVERKAKVLADWGTPEAYGRAFEETHALISPFPAAMMLAPEGRVVRPFELFGRENVVQERFFREWCAPQHLDDFIGATVVRRPRGDIVLGFARRCDQRPFDAEVEEFLGLLVPHVARSLHISGLLEGLHTERDDVVSLIDALAMPVLLLERNMRLSYLNQAAVHMLEADSSYAVRANIFHLNDSVVDAKLRSAVSQGRPIALGIGDPVSVSLTAVPLDAESGVRARMALFVSRAPIDLPPPAAPLVATYGLTPAELRILVLLMTGATPEAAARDLGVKISSVRTHMTNMFRKTGTTRQAELIAKTVSLLSPILADRWET